MIQATLALANLKRSPGVCNGPSELPCIGQVARTLCLSLSVLLEVRPRARGSLKLTQSLKGLTAGGYLLTLPEAGAISLFLREYLGSISVSTSLQVLHVTYMKDIMLDFLFFFYFIFKVCVSDLFTLTVVDLVNIKLFSTFPSV